jgi:hypothetical protein
MNTSLAACDEVLHVSIPAVVLIIVAVSDAEVTLYMQSRRSGAECNRMYCCSNKSILAQ